MENVEEMETQISVIEQSHKQQILSIHENMQQLVYDCNAIVVTEEDKEAYDKAVELKRLVKKTHVAIENKRKELKQPIKEVNLSEITYWSLILIPSETKPL